MKFLKGISLKSIGYGVAGDILYRIIKTDVQIAAAEHKNQLQYEKDVQVCHAQFDQTNGNN
jgi:hypothetical protein